MATKLEPKPNLLLEKMKKALALQQAGEVEKAQRIYKLVVKKAPNSPDANHLLGVSYRQLGDPKQAFDYIRKAIELAPDRAPYYANLARTMSDLAGTEPESILAVTEKALSLDPNLVEALNLKAISLSRLDRKPEAEEIFQFLIVKCPDFPDPYRNYGILLRDNKVYDKGHRLLQQGRPARSGQSGELRRAGHAPVWRATTSRPPSPSWPTHWNAFRTMATSSTRLRGSCSRWARPAKD